MPRLALKVPYARARIWDDSGWSLAEDQYTYKLETPPIGEAAMPTHPAEMLSLRLLRRGHLCMDDLLIF